MKRTSPFNLGFEDVLAEKKNLVWPVVKKYLKDPPYPKTYHIPSRYQDDAKFHWQLVNEYPNRKGKYLRPTLLLLTCEALGVSPKFALPTAAAMQISEEWLLVHDDIEDDSLERRGQPTLHRINGKELAINAGDTLHLIMWKVLMDNPKILGTQKSQEIMEEFYRILMRTALGQTVELKWARENKANLTDADFFFIVDGKTSYYTITGPMRLGAIIAGGTSFQISQITQFGKILGRCFQIRDDVLDLTSDFKGLKKQTGNDIYESKRTLILAHLLRTVSGSAREKLLKIMAKPRERKSPSEINWVIELIRKLGSIDYAQKIANQMAEQSLTIFEQKLKFLSQEPAREQLKAAINFIVERKF